MRQLDVFVHGKSEIGTEGDIYQPPVLEGDVMVDLNISIEALLAGLTLLDFSFIGGLSWGVMVGFFKLPES